jgi:3-methyladenine DNA glycosylase Tag
VAKVSFKSIRERAARRKGGDKVLASLMPKKPNNKALAKLTDDRVLSEMAARVFSAGFVWDVIDKKWPGFEEAFLGFNPKRLLFQPAEFWENLASDKRIVRNAQKIKSVRENAKFVTEIAAEHGSFGKFLAWAASAASTCCASSAGMPSCCRATCCSACATPACRSAAAPRRRTCARHKPRSMRGLRKAACRSPTSRASAPCRSAPTMTWRG